MRDAQFRPLIVIDFTCDHCHKKLDAVVVTRVGVPKKIARSYHVECWDKHVKGQHQVTEARSTGAN